MLSAILEQETWRIWDRVRNRCLDGFNILIFSLSFDGRALGDFRKGSRQYEKMLIVTARMSMETNRIEGGKLII